MIRLLELFCGIGGFRYGLEKANSERWLQGQRNGDLSKSPCREGFHCVWANDIDKSACQVYRKHYGEVYEGDIRAVDPATIPEHDLLCAGFPCQSFSIAGKRGGFEDTRGTLFFEICRILRAKGTKYALLENVKGLLSHDNGVTFQTIIGTLDELGYDCQWQVLNSKNYGVPQNRERVFIIGHLRGQPRPKVFPIGEADEIYTEPDGQISHAIDSNYHKGWLDNQQRTMVAMTERRTREAKEIRKVSMAGGIDFSPRRGKEIIEREDDTGNSVTAGQSKEHYVTDRQSIRRLTPIECERLQGFPDGWTEGVSDTQRYKCLGNAVTTNVITAIGSQWLRDDD